MDNAFIADNYMIYFSIGSIISGISLIITLIASIILVSKIAKPSTYLILFGAILKVITLLFGFFIPHISSGSENLITFQAINSIFIGFSVLIFAIGLIMFSTQIIQEKTKP
ncbi:hypothetical protein [Flavivirga eckloniae]|uniref:Uncharacterized protein n=1 Tax=Flavivirga eckloniae TaxID=1803846 RepID=A0A2K9PLB6_9FLAO|nr:hypothetical protein [Flavivirga eckloniae]AUP77861.1 hypothetical protein C1H87_03665 [Flavivirga eckloniae]